MAKREHMPRITGAIRPRLLYAQRVEIADRFRAWAARSACQPTPDAFVAFLSIYGLLDEPRVLEYLHATEEEIEHG